MKFLPRLLPLLAALLAASSAIAQWVGPPPMESIDLPAANSKEVFRGNLVDFARSTDQWGGYEMTIDVMETIKGTLHGRVHLHIFGNWGRDMLKWPRVGSSLLLGIPENPKENSSIIDLSDEDLAVFTADLKLLRSQDEILRAMRELVRKTAGVSKVDEYTRNVPVSQIDGKLPTRPTSGHFSRIGQLETIALRVPVDERLEKYGQKLVDSASWGERVRGIDIIRRFNSPNNVRRLKQLLSDPGWTWTFNSGTNKTEVYWINTVRSAAFEALESMGISCIRPITEDPADPRAHIVSVDLQDRNVSSADVDDLRQYPNLIDLSVANDRLDSGTIASLCSLKPLKMLYLQSSDISDEGLERLAELPNLTYLNLANTPITSAGLATLAKFKALRRVDVGFGESDPGIARLRRLRQDIEVQADEFAFLGALKPKRVEMGFGGRTVHAEHGLSPEIWRYGLVIPAEGAAELDELLRKELRSHGWKPGIPGPGSEILSYYRDRSSLPPPNSGMHRDVVSLPAPAADGYEQTWGVKSPPGGRLVVIERMPAYSN